MLTQTSESAIRELMFLAIQKSREPVSLKLIAETLGESPTYLATVTRSLAKAGILRSHRGALGGVELVRQPEEITLLSVVECCQGGIRPSYCREIGLAGVCGYHRAVHDLNEAMIGVLSRWTLADLLARPVPTGARAGDGYCRMHSLTPLVRRKHG